MIAEKEKSNRNFFVFFLGGIGIILICFFVTLLVVNYIQSELFITVEPWERVVVHSWSADDGWESSLLGPGNHFKGFGNKFVSYDLRVQEYAMGFEEVQGNVIGDDAILGLTRDGQQAAVEVVIKYQIQEEDILEISRSLRSNIRDEIVRPESRFTIRDNLTSFYSYEIDGKEELLARLVFADLSPKFSENGLELISIDVISFSLRME